MASQSRTGMMAVQEAGRGRVRPGCDRERALADDGIWPVAGVDEAGRGPLAGPVCAAAVVLNLDAVPAGLDDSKRLSAAARDALFEAILARSAAAAIAFASVEEIDATDIRAATHLAMRRAVAALRLVPAHVLVDGCDLPRGLAGEAVVCGDGLHASISAASILAKVARDRLMRRADAAFPLYGFARHVGYPTAAHRAALARYGACPLHRRSFAPLRHALGDLSEKNTGRGDQP